MLAAMHKYVVISETEFPAPLMERLQLQRLLPLAIDRAIFENLPALSERASSVACNTTAELILKVCGTPCFCTRRVMSLAEAIGVMRIVFTISEDLPGLSERTSCVACNILGRGCLQGM